MVKITYFFFLKFPATWLIFFFYGHAYNLKYIDSVVLMIAMKCINISYEF